MTMTNREGQAERMGTYRVFLDMDGVVVDFDSYKNSRGLTGEEVKKKPGAYLEMSMMPGARAAIQWLIGSGYDVWLATKPPTGISFAYSDKAEWVFRNLPDLKRKIILTHDKGLLGDVGDVLIDDRPHKANCEKLKGRLIPFKSWEQALSDLRRPLAPEARPMAIRRVAIAALEEMKQ